MSARPRRVGFAVHSGSPIPEAEPLVSGCYSPSSSPKKDSGRDRQNVAYSADGAAHRNDKAKTDGENCRSYQADYRNQRDLQHLLSSGNSFRSYGAGLRDIGKTKSTGLIFAAIISASA